METSSLEHTAERARPDNPKIEYWFKRNLAGYHFALPSIKPDDRVLDLGSGEGYGLETLRKKARRCLGIDAAFDATYHAARKYRHTLIVGDASRLPLAGATIDVILSLQVIEHLSAVDDYLREIDRVLRPGGSAWLSTPNRLTFIGSPFHIHEFTPQEFQASLAAVFSKFKLWGVNLKPERSLYYQAALAQTPATEYWVNGQMNLTAERIPSQLRQWIPTPLKKMTRLLLRTWWKTQPLTTEDFYLTEDGLEQSLDLIACVTK